MASNYLPDGCTDEMCCSNLGDEDVPEDEFGELCCDRCSGSLADGWQQRDYREGDTMFLCRECVESEYVPNADDVDILFLAKSAMEG